MTRLLSLLVVCSCATQGVTPTGNEDPDPIQMMSMDPAPTGATGTTAHASFIPAAFATPRLDYSGKSSTFLLRWARPESQVSAVHLYASTTPFDGNNKPTPSVLSKDAVSAEVSIPLASGMHYYRIAAVGTEEGPLSPQLIVDSTRRLLVRRAGGLAVQLQPTATGPGASSLVAPSGTSNLQFAPDGQHMAFTEGTGKKLDVADAMGGNHLTLSAAASGPIAAFMWSPDSQRLAYISDPDTPGLGELFTASLPNGPPVKVSTGVGPSGSINMIAFSPDGSRLYYDIYRGPQRSVYTVASGGGASSLVSVDPSGAPLSSVSFQWSPDSQTLYAFDSIAHRVLWVPASGGKSSVVSGALDAAGFVLSPNGKRILFVTQTHGLYLSDALISNEAVNTPVEWSKDGDSFAYVAPSGAARVHNAVDGQELPIGATGTVSQITFSPNGKRVAVTSTGNVCVVTTLATGAQQVFSDLAYPQWSSDGDALVGNGTGNHVTIVIFDSGTGVSFDAGFSDAFSGSFIPIGVPLITIITTG